MRRRPNTPQDPRIDVIHRLAKRVAVIHGDDRGNFRNGVLRVSASDVVRVDIHVNAVSWESDTVYHFARDLEAERTSVNREFNQLGIPMKGGAEYWKVVEYNPDLADLAIRLLNQQLVLDELARVLDNDADPDE